MPYSIKYQKSHLRPWVIIKDSTGKIIGSSRTKSDAEASIRARYMGEKK